MDSMDDSEVIDKLISEAVFLCLKITDDPLLAMMHIHDSISKSLRNFETDKKRKFNEEILR